jgi:outer membrane lipoprotein carrier protein
LATPLNILTLCLLLCGLANPVEKDVSAVVVAMQQRYASFAALSADFRQTYRAPGMESTESGRLIVKKPALMRWEYLEPERKLFITDGRDSYLYTPGDHQVLVRPFGVAEMRGTPLRFLVGDGDVLEGYSVTWEKEFKPLFTGTYLVRLEPRAGEPEYSFVVIECDVTTYDLRRLTVRERTGNSSEFVFTRWANNVKVGKREFEFKIPKGTEVIQLDEK